MASVSCKRQTTETDISMSLSPDGDGAITIATGLPFFDHLLHSMAFHGGLGLTLQAKGDTDVDPHHLVEDTGLVLGSLLDEWARDHGPVRRFAEASIPMDEALSRVVVDVCGRSTAILRADFPQPNAGQFDIHLIREFWIALANRARISLHGIIEYGENSHHMVEALFKALGIALQQAYTPRPEVRSTKGILD